MVAHLWNNEKCLIKAVLITSIATLLVGVGVFYVSHREEDLNATITAADVAKIQFEATSESLVLADDVNRYVVNIPMTSYIWMAYYGLSGIEPTSSLSSTSSTTMDDYLAQVSSSIKDYNDAITMLDNKLY